MNSISPRTMYAILLALGAPWLIASIPGWSVPPLAMGLMAATGVLATLWAASDKRGHTEVWFSALLEDVRSSRTGSPPGNAPPDSPAALTRVYAELTDSAADISAQTQREEDLKREMAKLSGELQNARTSTQRLEAELAEALTERNVPDSVKGLLDKLTADLITFHSRMSSHLSLSSQGEKHTQELSTALGEVARHVELLAANAEECSSAILQMTTTNDRMAENIGELGSSVRESVSSIEEMTFSIKEVAKNVDALSLTAEETSSSMNEMDVSIDQVQSNANETARLSEEVAHDAETGAKAILKTIGEIYRIKESTQEAVSVISNLGTRIDAIGQILNVIDEVAEQTNLLALNAAIIAAQAGEHGKGFAVVADEIKDLAERAGASTKEIAELIKTIQSESRNAIQAVERGAQNVDRGVQVSNDAERALKKILESSQKSTNMVRAIARATVEQAKGSKQVTDSIGRIAETVQQIAAATAEQARGSELIMTSGEKMRTIAQQVERSSQEQSRGGRQITQAIETISSMVNQLNATHRQQSKDSERALEVAHQLDSSLKSAQLDVDQLEQQIQQLNAGP